jgi:PQQ-like domain
VPGTHLKTWRAWGSAAFLTLLLCVGCVSAQPAGVATPHFTVAPKPASSYSTSPTALPFWRYALRAGWDASQVRVGGDTVIVGGRSSVFALNPASGILRWKKDDGASAVVIDKESVFYGTRTGAGVLRRLRDGGLRWKRDGVCPLPNRGAPVRGLDVALRSAADFVVGCSGGGAVQIDAATGRVRARSGAFAVDQISEIVPLGSCAYGIIGWSSGATIREQAEIVSCKRLKTIVPGRTDTSILGSIGDVAVLDDTCCNGRPDVYRPATIVLANLATGAVSPEVDLTPEPARYPPDQRPLGQGSAAMLEGSELYLAVDHALYKYGNPQSPSASPKRVADNLVEPPLMLTGRLIVMRTRNANGTTTDNIVRIRKAAFEPVSTISGSGAGMFRYDSTTLPDILIVFRSDGGASYRSFVRIDDRRRLDIEGECQPVGSDRAILVMLCATKTIVGNRYLQYLTAYRWPNG